MFVDFNNIFKNNKEQNLKIPNVLVEYLNEKLPEGVRYDVDANGKLKIVGEKTISISGFTFKPSKKQKEILGDNPNNREIVEYSYNSQQEIPLALKNEGYIILNNETIKIDDIILNSINLIKQERSNLYFCPCKFPPPFRLNVGCKKYKRELLVSRVANNSVNIIEFKSDEQDPLVIHLFINKKNSSATMNISFNLFRAKTIRDIVESTSIYNAYIAGEGTMMDESFQGVLKGKVTNKFDDSSIAFWEKVMKIEKILNIKFSPPKENVDFETICLVEKLYQNLIRKTPTRSDYILNSLDGNGSVMADDIKEHQMMSIFFELASTSKFELFGVELELPTLIGLFNYAISEYKIIDGKLIKLIFKDESLEKKRYATEMYFVTEEELHLFREKYRNEEKHKEMEELFRDAKMPYEYVD